MQRCDVERAFSEGDVVIEGKGSDIELENIAGQVTVNGSYSGMLQFRKLLLHSRIRIARFQMQRLRQVLPGAQRLTSLARDLRRTADRRGEGRTTRLPR